MVKEQIVRISLFTDGANNVDLSEDKRTKVDEIKEVHQVVDGESKLKISKYVYGMGDLGNTREVSDRFGAYFRHLNEDALKELKLDYLQTFLTIEQSQYMCGIKPKIKTPRNSFSDRKEAPNLPLKGSVVDTSKFPAVPKDEPQIKSNGKQEKKEKKREKELA